MFYEILTVTPFVAIASCITLGVATIVVCISESLPKATGFVVHDRRKAGPSVRARTPMMRLTGGSGAHRDFQRCA
jgi:hypothetical protein